MSCSREREAWGRDARLAHGREGGASARRNPRAKASEGGEELLKQRQQPTFSTLPTALPASPMSSHTLR